MSGKICQICGKKSGIYPLCKEHLEMKNEGLVIKNEKNNQWILVDDTQELIEYDNKSQICCICGKDAPFGKQCHDCYYETIEYKINIDKNRKAHELREWYYNLKNSIFRQTGKYKKQSNCNKLIALALLCRDVHGDDSLISRVYKDIEYLLKPNEKAQKEQEEQETLIDFDMQKNETSGQVKCIDGHWVENDLEREIDDMLYQLREPHVYAKKVNEITSRAVKSDWFIPVLSDTKGIYIELWGMETAEYKKNKEEKIALYKEEELALIEIYRKEILSDKTLLRETLYDKINEIKKELKKKR